MPLQRLAEQLVRIGDAGKSTPVLVTPAYLQLRPVFVIALVQTLCCQSGRPVRVDWQKVASSGIAGLGQSFWARWQTRRINGVLHREMNEVASSESASSVQITHSISRPSTSDDWLVVGLSDRESDLPPWAASIRFATSPSTPVDLKAA